MQTRVERGGGIRSRDAHPPQGIQPRCIYCSLLCGESTWTEVRPTTYQTAELDWHYIICLVAHNPSTLHCAHTPRTGCVHVHFWGRFKMYWATQQCPHLVCRLPLVEPHAGACSVSVCHHIVARLLGAFKSPSRVLPPIGMCLWSQCFWSLSSTAVVTGPSGQTCKTENEKTA